MDYEYECDLEWKRKRKKIQFMGWSWSMDTSWLIQKNTNFNFFRVNSIDAGYHFEFTVFHSGDIIWRYRLSSCDCFKPQLPAAVKLSHVTNSPNKDYNTEGCQNLYDYSTAVVCF